ncbi:MAG: protein TolR [Bdellovibrio sp.]|nr:MAG: protein TolR [Bdellovibrio sp.]
MSPASSSKRMTMSEINVTPLVDVMLVLLIMFMVTAPLMQQGIEVDLPKTASSSLSTPPEDPLVLIINADRNVVIGKQKVPAASLREKLRAIMETRKNQELYIQADRHVEYGFVAETMAEIRAAGITNIGLVTVPKEGK